MHRLAGAIHLTQLEGYTLKVESRVSGDDASDKAAGKSLRYITLVT